MRLTNALVYVLTLVLGLFAFFSSYIALHHQNGGGEDRPYDPAAAGGEGNARTDALRFSRGGFNITSLQQRAIRTAREELSALKEALHLNQITARITDLAAAPRHPSATSPAAIRQRRANRTTVDVSSLPPVSAVPDQETAHLRQQVAALQAALEQQKQQQQQQSGKPGTEKKEGKDAQLAEQVAMLTAELKRAQARAQQLQDEAAQRQPAKPAVNTASSSSSSSNMAPAEPVGCRASFEPTCDMYPYVRFWNHRFRPSDCYQSPLRHPSGRLAPLEERKYVVFEPDHGGWNNIRMAAEVRYLLSAVCQPLCTATHTMTPQTRTHARTQVAIIFAHATGRTLVMPPIMVFYLLNKDSHGEDNQSTFDKVLGPSLAPSIRILCCKCRPDRTCSRCSLCLPLACKPCGSVARLVLSFPCDHAVLRHAAAVRGPRYHNDGRVHSHRRRRQPPQGALHGLFLVPFEASVRLPSHPSLPSPPPTC